MLEPPTDTTGSPIKEFIEQTKNQALAGLGDWEFKAPIELELNTIVSGKAGGGIDIKVINFGAKVEAEQQQKIKISIGPKDEAEQEEKKAKIETAKYLQKRPHLSVPNVNK
ncbi:hypothetical protein COU60_00790 [Candidatus Pacearchaeota archaeon CG10_big_fil_rev_8_21_14_0_10_34_76]|nr:MAG: hypothetical protein COU60_00790 [Candidatus Pacearchaeota archaeon CG10_big_fil_rev_8_21_14_0_10_34_76]